MELFCYGGSEEWLEYCEGGVREVWVSHNVVEYLFFLFSFSFFLFFFFFFFFLFFLF